MSDALFQLGGLRFWHEDEIELREAFQARAVAVIRRALLALNPAWRFARTEGPCLHPRDRISAAYDDADLFATNHEAGGGKLYLRAETTPSSYAFARHLGGKLPICVWQSGKSFRRETNDGASAAKLRFNEFYQLEFQAIHRADSHADYRAAMMAVAQAEIARFTGLPTRVVDSDRLPSYSRSTLDIEADVPAGAPGLKSGWREVASCSIRTDYAPDALVAEIAIGLDRVATLASARGREAGR